MEMFICHPPKDFYQPRLSLSSSVKTYPIYVYQYTILRKILIILSLVWVSAMESREMKMQIDYFRQIFLLIRMSSIAESKLTTWQRKFFDYETDSITVITINVGSYNCRFLVAKASLLFTFSKWFVTHT